MKKIASVSAALCLLLVIQSNAQNDTTIIELTGYIDTYYASYSNKLATGEMQPYITVAPRDNQFGLNIAEIGATYNTGEVRGTFVIQYGDIAEATWSERFKTIQEAWVGVEITEGVWLDGGFFTTHIGAESFLPKNNYLSSTDIGTYNEPFYQSGARVSYERSEKFDAQFHLVSGYNLFLDNNDAKSVGMLFSYKFNEDISLAYTNLYGRESPEDSDKQNRFYHNIYLTWDPNDKVSTIIGGDMSTQTNSKLNEPTETAVMFNAVAIARYRFTDRYSTTGRLEFFNDKDGFISGVLVNQDGERQGLKASAFTLGLEYAPTRQSYLRAETRWTWADKDLLIFNKGGNASNTRTEFVINMGFYFDKRLK
ncbi:Putative beta-barrel porin-2, OmpL-like. bbp2 [Ekhidna lutea]|uniref:Putative beta-barrel porin-2, OmpL-like. bbp2 n=1 Tax=Ekhidna lutea TaxID=447679 RepID=A0A239GK72_EKHLU|nr:outer membrane beta-barrel protein [Ekhidna lutea]SNS69540.1 Putative beta-barrel porin-2, OmpL-like. bbp2 [Ekhidna lutea]